MNDAQSRTRLTIDEKIFVIALRDMIETFKEQYPDLHGIIRDAALQEGMTEINTSLVDFEELFRHRAVQAELRSLYDFVVAGMYEYEENTSEEY